MKGRIQVESEALVFSNTPILHYSKAVPNPVKTPLGGWRRPKAGLSGPGFFTGPLKVLSIEFQDFVAKSDGFFKRGNPLILFDPVRPRIV